MAFEELGLTQLEQDSIELEVWSDFRDKKIQEDRAYVVLATSPGLRMIFDLTAPVFHADLTIALMQSAYLLSYQFGISIDQAMVELNQQVDKVFGPEQ